MNTTDYTTNLHPSIRVTMIDGAKTVPCRYCGTPVPEETDPETGDTGFTLDDGTGRYAAHWSCVHEDRNGHHVVTLTNTVTGNMTWHRYNTRQRALEMGARYRGWNLREWNCGRNLDIEVTCDDPKGVAYTAESF